MNVHESEKIAGLLISIGYIETSNINFADIIVLNTCCVRENAENKVFGHLGEIKRLKKNKKDLIVVVCGCMSQEKGMAEKIKTKYPFINFILGSNNYYELPSLLNEYKINKKNRILVPDNSTNPVLENIPIYRTSGTNAWVNIMYGCNNFCTYCIVPYVKGREVSRDNKLILKEINELLELGYKEITLLGQNVDSYNYNNYKFVNLLDEISCIDKKFRLRFMSSHPKDFNKDVINIIKNSPNICKNIHLPIQSGSDNILKLMNRHYTKFEYLDIVDNIKSNIPNIGLTTDIMVGFPQESDDDFNETIEIVKKVQYTNAFMFVYSPRIGTPAAKMEQINEDIKKSRIIELVNLQNNISSNISKNYINSNEEILVEDVVDNNLLCGRTDNGRLVTFNGSNKLLGQFVKVKITKTKASSLYGELIHE